MAGIARTHLRVAWGAFKLHRRVFILSVLVLFASWVSLELAVVALQRLGVAVNVLLHLGFLILFSGLMVGLHEMALQAVAGHPPAVSTLTASLARGPSYLLALCLYLVAVAAGVLLLVAPGIYLAVRYALFGQVLAAENVSGLDAWRAAGSLSQGRWWMLFRFLLVVAALNLAGAALLGVGLLVTFPVTVLATSSLYRTLAGQGEAAKAPRA